MSIVASAGFEPTPNNLEGCRTIPLYYEAMVVPEGVEPSVSWSVAKRFNPLNYGTVA